MSTIHSMKSASVTLPSDKGLRLTPVQWLICVVACIGFAFDLYETLMLPLIVRPALVDVAHLKPGSHDFNLWVGLLFFVPSAVGGIVGFLGGYLTDFLGRRKVLVWSILFYGFSACAAAFSASLTTLLIFRCVTLGGVSVEFVAAITWLAEIFPEPKRRESMLGFTQACTSFGGLMVTGAYYLAVTFGDHFPAIRGSHEAWRYTLLSGMIPALPLIVVRPWLPESPIWRDKKLRGTLERPRPKELFHPALRRTTLITTLLVACAFALPYGAIQHTSRMVPGLPDVRVLAPRQVEQAVSGAQLFQELGGLSGRVLFALFIIRIASPRRRIGALLGPSLFVFSWLYFFAATHNLPLVKFGIFLVTLLFNALHSFWGNYLPTGYPTHLRGTGESFATNIGGRVIGVFAALLTTQLSNVMPGAGPAVSLAHSAGLVAAVACTVGLVATLWLPEPEGDQLPD